MKTSNVVIIALAAVVGVYLLAQAMKSKGVTTIIQEAPDRSTAEQLLTGIGALAEGLGSGAADVARALTPSVGHAGSSRSS